MSAWGGRPARRGGGGGASPSALSQNFADCTERLCGVPLSCPSCSLPSCSMPSCDKCTPKCDACLSRDGRGRTILAACVAISLLPLSILYFGGRFIGPRLKNWKKTWAACKNCKCECLSTAVKKLCCCRRCAAACTAIGCGGVAAHLRGCGVKSEACAASLGRSCGSFWSEACAGGGLLRWAWSRPGAGLLVGWGVAGIACAIAAWAAAGAAAGPDCAAVGAAFSLRTWFAVFGLALAVLAGLSLYLFCRYDVPFTETVSSGGRRDTGIFERLWYRTAFDPVIIVFFVFVAFQTVWMGVGSSWSSSDEEGGWDPTCSPAAPRVLRAVLVIQWIEVCVFLATPLLRHVLRPCFCRFALPCLRRYFLCRLLLLPFLLCFPELDGEAEAASGAEKGRATGDATPPPAPGAAKSDAASSSGADPEALPDAAASAAGGTPPLDSAGVETAPSVVILPGGSVPSSRRGSAVATASASARSTPQRPKSSGVHLPARDGGALYGVSEPAHAPAAPRPPVELSAAAASVSSRPGSLRLGHPPVFVRDGEVPLPGGVAPFSQSALAPTVPGLQYDPITGQYLQPAPAPVLATGGMPMAVLADLAAVLAAGQGGVASGAASGRYLAHPGPFLPQQSQQQQQQLYTPVATPQPAAALPVTAAAPPPFAVLVPGLAALPVSAAGGAAGLLGPHPLLNQQTALQPDGNAPASRRSVVLLPPLPPLPPLASLFPATAAGEQQQQ